MFIELKNICKTINGVKVLDNINLRFETGTTYGLKGKNGCGKTMLMRTICGLVLPTNGSININDEILHKDISFPRSLGVLIENPAFISSYTGFINLKILSNIQHKISDDTIKQTLTDVGLDFNDKRTYKKYSLGMKQRLGIASAIMEHPDIIILDEPINALDEKGIELVREILKKEKQRGAIIIIACHDREELEGLSDLIISMEDGRVCE